MAKRQSTKSSLTVIDDDRINDNTSTDITHVNNSNVISTASNRGSLGAAHSTRNYYLFEYISRKAHDVKRATTGYIENTTDLVQKTVQVTKQSFLMYKRLHM